MCNYRKSIGLITPGIVRKSTMLGATVYGVRFLFAFDDYAKGTYAATPGPVGKALAKLVGAVLLSHTAVAYQLKHVLKASETDIARVNLLILLSYVACNVWGLLTDRILKFDGLIVTGVLSLLNAFVGYA